MNDDSHVKTVEIRRLKDKLGRASKRVGTIEGECKAKAAVESKARARAVETNAASREDASREDATKGA